MTRRTGPTSSTRASATSASGRSGTADVAGTRSTSSAPRSAATTTATAQRKRPADHGHIASLAPCRHRSSSHLVVVRAARIVNARAVTTTQVLDEHQKRLSWRDLVMSLFFLGAGAMFWVYAVDVAAGALG